MPATVFLVTLEGNIGSGKSTLLHAVEALDHADVVVVQEPVDLWCAPALPDGQSMLKAYYSAPAKTAMAFQMYTMLTRVQQIAKSVIHARAKAAASGRNVVVLTERCSWSDYEIFGRPMRDLGILSDAEWFTYTAWFKAVTDVGGGPTVGESVRGIRPTGLVYLRCSAEKCIDRITERARSGEQDIDVAYVRRLHVAHETYVASAREPGSGYKSVLEIDGSAEGTDAVQIAAERVVGFVLHLC
jgi:deoxyadenosine/deoxycytidine kinase